MYEPDANMRWREGCRRIFEEENLRYEIDNKGGVHFKVDAEFAASTRASIAALGLPRYANSRAAYEKAMGALSGFSFDGKEGIRDEFNAVECIYAARPIRRSTPSATGSMPAATIDMRKS